MDLAQRVPRLVWPSVYYSPLLFCVGKKNNTARGDMEISHSIGKGEKSKGVEAKMVFSLILLRRGKALWRTQ